MTNESLHRTLSDEDVEALQARNQKRLEAYKQKMGDKYILHPSRTLSKKECKRNAYILEAHRKINSY